MLSMLSSGLVAAALSTAAATDGPQTCTTIFEFNDAAAVSSWDTMNDNVMGGRSQGGPSFGDAALVFEGFTNTDGGGFSSISAGTPKGSLAGVSAFQVRYRGDGRRYLFSLETGEKRWVFFRIHYWHEFATDAEAGWQVATLPVSGFEAYYHGDPIKGRTLKTERIKDLGFFIYDKEHGPFALEVDWIKACR